jgi:putative transposase
MGLKRSSHAVYDTNYHLVWCPKRRKDIFAEKEVRERADQVVREICDEYGFEITDMEVAENHIYIS